MLSETRFCCVSLCWEWLYGTYFGRFWGFVADFKAIAMGQVVLLG